MDEPRPDRRLRLLAIAALVILVAAIYAPVVDHAFVAFDSGTYITQNEHVAGGLSWENLRWAFTTFHAANWHPLTWISHQLDVQLFRARPGWHHAVNAALHALNGVLVFLVLAAATRRAGASFVVALLFAAHPLHVESVAWIVERKDVLSTCFGLLALHAWVRFARDGGSRTYVLALVAYAASLMSKPTLVTWPFVLLLCDAWPLARAQRGWSALVREKLPFFVLAALSCWITLSAQRAGGALQGLHDLPLAARAENALASLAWYEGKTFWPSALSFYYPLQTPSTAAVLAGALSLVLVTWIVLANRARAPWLAWGWFVFVGTLVPVIGLVQVGGQARADRYAYVPVLGLFTAVVFTLDVALSERLARRGIVLAVTLLFAFLARTQVGTWRDSETLARHALRVDPENHVALDLLGWTVFERGNTAEGLELLDRAVAAEPRDPDARGNYARALLRAGPAEDAERELRQALSLRPDQPALLVGLGTLLSTRGAFEEAAAALRRAVELAPRDATARVALGEHLDRTGNIADSEAEFRAAIELAPDDPRARIDLAAACMVRGRRDEARANLDLALQSDPHSPQGLQLRAKLRAEGGDARGAILDLRAALVARPNWPLAQIDLAWLLATAPDERARDPDEAVSLASEAVNAGNQERALHLDVLAAAYAAQGRFEAAVKTAEVALRRAEERRERVLAEKIRARLAAYRAGHMDLETPR